MGISLQKLLILPFVLQVAGITGLVGYWSYRSGQQAVEDVAHQLMEETGSLISQELDAYLQTAYRINQSNIAALRSGAINLDNLDQLHRYLILQHQQFPEVTTLLLGTPEGDFRTIHSVSPAEVEANLTQISPTELPFEAGASDDLNSNLLKLYAVTEAGNLGRYLEQINNIDVRERPWYHQAVARGKPGWTEPFQIGASNLLTINAYAPFYNGSQQLSGVFSVNLSLERLNSFLATVSIREHGQTFILERNGLLIATSEAKPPYRVSSEDIPPVDQPFDPNQPLSIYFRRLAAAESGNPATQLAAQQLIEHFGSLAQIQAPQILTFDVKDNLHYLYVVPYQDGYGLDWLIVTTIPQADFMTAIQASVRRTALLCGLALLGTIGFGIWLARRITQPVLALDRAIQTFEADNALPTTAATHIQEVESLRQAFQRMAERLHRSFTSLKDSEQKLTTFLDSVPVGISIFDRSGQVTLINRIGTEILGKGIVTTPTEKLSETYQIYVAGTQDLYPSDRLPSVRALQGETVYADDIEIAVNGCRLPLEVQTSPVFDEDGNISYVINAFRDITEQRQAEKAQTVFNESTDALFLVDTETLLTVDCNQRAIDLFEASDRSDLLGIEGHTLQKQLFTPGELEQIRHDIDTDGFWKLELEYVTRRGRSFWGSLSAKPINVGQQRFNLVRVTDISDRKHAELALQEKTEELDRFFSVALDLLCIADTDGHFRRLNHQWEKTLGYSLQELAGARFLNFVHPDDVERTLAELSTLSHQQESHNFVNRYRCRDGSYRWIEWRSVPVGHLIYAAARDITERIRTESALKKTNQQLQTLLTNAPVAIHLFDTKGRYLQVNPQCADVFGLSPQEMVGKTFADLFPQSTIELFHTRLQQIIDTGQPLEVEDEISVDGGSRTFRSLIFPANVEQQRISTFWSIATDITARKVAELALKQREERLRMVINATQEGIWDWDIKQNRSWWSPRHYQMLGLEPAEVEENSLESILERIHPDDRPRVEYLLQKHWEDRQPFSAEYRVRRADQSYGWFLGRGQALFDENGQPYRMVGSFADITDRKQAAFELEQAKDAAEAANRAKSRFIANISHELRSPLNAILGFIRIMKDDPTLSADHQESASIIEQSGEHLLSIINQVLDLAKIEANRAELNLTSFDLEQLLNDLHALFNLKAEAKGIGFLINCDPDLPRYLKTDEMKLRQVLINLLDNAFKFTHQGYVQLQVTPLSITNGPTCHLQFAIEDTGPGIAEQEQSLLFQAFSQTQTGLITQSGTGLGLVISQEFVRLMGGTLIVDSQPGKGSLFTFDVVCQSLPAPAFPVEERRRKVVGLLPGHPRYRLLVVDDSPVNRRLLCHVLSVLNLEVQQAENGEEALKLWESWHPHVIWMDLRMPVMDGFAATRAIRQQEIATTSTFVSPLLQTVIIAVSATSLQITTEEVLESGFDEFITKPFKTRNIFYSLQRFLGLQYRYQS